MLTSIVAHHILALNICIQSFVSWSKTKKNRGQTLRLNYRIILYKFLYLNCSQPFSFHTPFFLLAGAGVWGKGERIRNVLRCCNHIFASRARQSKWKCIENEAVMLYALPFAL